MLQSYIAHNLQLPSNLTLCVGLNIWVGITHLEEENPSTYQNKNIELM